MNPDLTEVSRPTQWKPGQSGNLNGRPVGTRQAFSAGFLRVPRSRPAFVPTMSGSTEGDEFVVKPHAGIQPEMTGHQDILIFDQHPIPIVAANAIFITTKCKNVV